MLNSKIINEVLMAAISKGGDFAEIFIEDRFSTGLTMIGGKIENSLSGKSYGLGLRIFNGNNSIYTYTSDLSESNLIRMAKESSEVIGGYSKELSFELVKEEYNKIHLYKKLPNEVDKRKKIELMRKAHNASSSHDDIITQTVVNYMDYDQKVLIANTDGLLIEDQRVRTRTSVSAVATHNGEMQTGSASYGALNGFELYDGVNIEDYGLRAAKMAKNMAKAELCPSGKMPVVIDNGFGGVVFHEACGHGLEATSVAKGISVYTDKLGEKIASDIVTAVDDGTMLNAWGSQHYDDEGSKMQKNVLIENGILKKFMVDKLNGRRMKTESTGSGRRQSYKFAPTSRMTNTYIAPGKSKIEDMIKSIDKGIYAKTMGGGSVNPATGDFNFAVLEAYFVEGGEIRYPVRGATLIGRGSDVLENITMVSDDLEYGYGMCGSSSGSIPVIVGQPAIKVSEITVGGRKE